MSDKPNPRIGTVNLPNYENIGYVSIANTEEREVEKPSLGETVKANFRLFNDVYAVGEYAYKSINHRFNDSVNENFNPKDEGYLEKVPQEYWAKVLSCENRNEADVVVNSINQELADKDTRARSGWFANLTSTLGAAIISPTTLFAASQTVKYAKMGQGTFANALQGAKTWTPTIALQNAALVLNKETENYKDWIHDTIVDSFMACSLSGALGLYTAKNIKGQFNNAKAYFKAIEDDIGIKYKLNENGSFNKMEAYALNDSVGAARVQTVQDIIDSGQVSFKNNKFVKHYFGFAQPIIEGLTSRFSVVNSFTNQMFSNPFLTAGGNIHAVERAGAENFLRVWNGTYSSLQIKTKEKWLDYLDIKGPAKGIRGAIGEFSGKMLPEKRFNEMVSEAIRRNGEHEIPQVAETAKAWIDELYNPLLEELKKRRPDFTEHEFSNIERYLNRIYDKAKIQERPQDFVDDVIRYLDETNKKILNYTKPINDLKESKTLLKNQLREFKAAIKVAEESRIPELKQAMKEIKALLTGIDEKLSGLDKRIQDDIMSGEIGLDMLREKPQFTPEQIKTIKELEKPILKAEENLAKAKKTKDKKKIKKAKENLELAKREQQEALEGADSALYRVNKQGFKVLRKVDELPKLRRPLSPHQIPLTAEGIKDTILQENEEQLVGKIFDAIQSGGGASALKERTFLWNDRQAERWLLNDINVLGGVYMDQLSKRIYADDVFLRYGINPREGQKGIVKLLKIEKNQERNKILKETEGEVRDKALKQLDKDFDKNVKFLENSYKVYMGNYVDRSALPSRIALALKQFAAATMLGNVPILQLSEFVAPLFKFTFDEYVFDGLVPALNRLKHISQHKIKEYAGESVEDLRGAFADANLGLNVSHGSRMNALLGYGAQYSSRTVAERYITNLANMSQNISLANHLSDMQETISAFASQSSLIRTLKKYLNGQQLSKREIDKLDYARINPEKYAERIVRQFESKGAEVEGAYLANFHLWSDLDASIAFRAAIEKEVRAVITKPGMLDIPFAFRDPVKSTIFQFMSWSFAATTNFTIPTLTNFDKQKMVGIVSLIALSSLLDPLRQLAKGEEPDLSFESLAASAFTNSGVFGWHFQELQKINSAIDFPFLKPFQSDRFRRKDLSSLFLGPSTGIITNMGSIISAAVNGEMNANDAKKAVYMTFPFANTWYTRKPINDWIDGLGMPANRYEAKRRKEVQ